LKPTETSIEATINSDVMGIYRRCMWKNYVATSRFDVTGMTGFG
jgi:hypothetical protein